MPFTIVLTMQVRSETQIAQPQGLANTEVQVAVVAFGWILLAIFGVGQTNWSADQVLSHCEPARPMIEINSADLNEFVMLPKVGPSMAQRIVSDRDANGQFDEVEDLLRVSGIGPKTLARLRPHVGVK